MNLSLTKRIRCAIILLLIVMVLPIYGQTIYTPFGKNRIQYHDDFSNWWMYETDHFVTFWYGKGRNIAKSVMQLAELDHSEIQELMAHSMNDKIRIVVYLDHSDYSQTNIAYWDTREAGGAGKARFYDNKVIVYFDGNHQNLRKQIKAGIARAFLISMFEGISIQEIYHNLVSSQLPEWFVSGLVSYIEDPWPPEIEEELRYYFENRERKVKRFSSFADKNPELAGHTMWNFLVEHYGKRSISDFLYLSRLHNDLNKASKYTYGLRAKELYKDWYTFYKNHYIKNPIKTASLDSAKLLKVFKHPITKLKLDNKGENLFYVENNFGFVKIKKRNLESAKEDLLLKYGYKNLHQISDFHYPLITLNEEMDRLGIIYELKDQIFFRDINLLDQSFNQHLMVESIHRIYDFEYLNKDFLIFSASTNGFVDIHSYDLEKRQAEELTENYFDELEIERGNFNGQDGYFVLSNNESSDFQKVAYDSFPPIGDPNLYFFNAKDRIGKLIYESPKVNESQLFVDSVGLYVISDRGYFENPEYWRISESTATINPQISLKNSQIICHTKWNDKYFFVRKIKPDLWALYLAKDFENLCTQYSGKEWMQEVPFSENISLEEIQLEKDEVKEFLELDESLLYQTKFDDPIEDSEIMDLISIHDSPDGNIAKKGERKIDLPVFNRSRAVASRLRFSFDQLVTKVDNQALFEGLETYNQYRDSYNPPPSGLLVKTTVKDFFEDHIIEGGIRLASDFRGMEYFLSYDDLAPKLDWKYSLYRKTESDYTYLFPQSIYPEKIKLKTNLAMVRAKYPFDIYRSIHFTSVMRFDRTILTASNIESLNTQDITSQRLILGIEYVFDNTSNKAPNLLTGTRYKIFTRFSNHFNIQLTDPKSFEWSKGRMGIVGLDVRHYFDVLEHSTLALRFAAQTSFGNEKNIYFLGGMENWYFGVNDQNYPIPQDQNFAYKIQAANMRGFPYNTRNGSTFALFNAEFRFPITSYLYSGHIKFSFFRDLQICGFLDIGSAWYGLTPLSDKNVQNVYYHEAPPAVLLKIRQFNDPVIAGTGFGLRTTVFGYFLKVDYAWGFDSGQFFKPMMYFSMGYDF